jgi:hypothetical protein
MARHLGIKVKAVWAEVKRARDLDAMAGGHLQASTYTPPLSPDSTVYPPRRIRLGGVGVTRPKADVDFLRT